MSICKIGTNEYSITIEVGNDINGKRRRIKRRFHGTKEDAEIRHAELMKQYYHKSKTINLNDMTFGEYSEKFIESYCKPNVSKVTLKDYEDLLKNIKPYLCDIKMRKITTPMLDTMYQKIKGGRRGKELSPKSMSHYYNLMSLMFKQAKRWKIIESNPNEDTIKPKLVRRKRNFYEKDAVTKLLTCLENESIKYKTIITLTLDSGIRRSELCAIRWGDIDFKNRTLLIDNSLKVIHGEVDEEKTKTEYSVRTIDLGVTTIELLKEYKRWQDDYILQLGNKWLGTDRVFTSKDGRHMHPDTCNKILQKVIEKYDLPHLTFHELRHTCASILNSDGIDAKTISERLGHADASITMNIYTHSFSANKKQCANVFDTIKSGINNNEMAQNIGTQA